MSAPPTARPTRPAPAGSGPTPAGSGRGPARSASLRSRRHPGQNALLFASLTLVVASFLPWVDTAFGSFSGMAGAGLYTFYAGVWGIGGSLVPWRRVALVHGVIVTAMALLLPAWQIASLVGRQLGGGWLPGTGIMLAIASGSLAARAVWQLARRE